MTLDFKQQSDLAYVVSALASPCLPFSQKQGRPVPGKELTCSLLIEYCAHCERDQ